MPAFLFCCHTMSATSMCKSNSLFKTTLTLTKLLSNVSPVQRISPPTSQVSFMATNIKTISLIFKSKLCLIKKSLHLNTAWSFHSTLGIFSSASGHGSVVRKFLDAILEKKNSRDIFARDLF